MTNSKYFIDGEEVQKEDCKAHVKTIKSMNKNPNCPEVMPENINSVLPKEFWVKDPKHLTLEERLLLDRYLKTRK
jgi:hypothetical protein